MAQDNPQSRGYTGADAQNTPDAKAIHNSSTFGPDMLGYEFYDTLRFGEYHPFTAMEVVPKDIVTAQFKHNIMSYTLKAPLMQGIQVKKSIFQVPREAILPFNWEKWFKNPVIGQDIPDDVGTSIAGFWTKVKSMCEPMWQGLQTAIQGSEPTDKAGFLHDMFRTLIFLEYFYSNGSLLKSLNISGSQFFRTLDVTGDRAFSFDKIFDKLIAIFANEFGANPNGGYAFAVQIGGKSYRVYVEIPQNVNNTTNCLNLREFLCMVRDEPIFTISSVDTTNFSSFFTIIQNDQDILLSVITDDDEEPIDLKRLWAYNLVCAHFMTNDKVDFIYSAELYRQYICELVTKVYGTAIGGGNPHENGFFTVNGLTYQYDYMSAYYFNVVQSDITADYSTAENESYAYIASLFCFKRSLRYLDYFTGSRTQPLAVGDVNVQVNSNLVNIVESERKRFLARMLNAINVAGMRQYVKELFGVEQAPDWHNPQSLITIADNVYGERVENTGDAQWTKANSVTSTLTGASDRYAFKMFFDRSSVLIGIAYFDIPRVYAYATERQNMHFDRFDEFQPMMEYIGDQKLYKGELGTPKFVSAGSLMDAFGYKLRNCEYKERYAQCAGGFVESLPGYIFKADILETVNITQQGSSFIRSFPSELDKFYLSLTGYSNGTYFHFICKWVNQFSAKRPMSYAPTLL